MSFSLANHEQKILDEIIGSLVDYAGLAEGDQILPFNLIKRFRVSYEEPDGGGGGKFLQAMEVGRNPDFCLSDAFPGSDRRFASRPV